MVMQEDPFTISSKSKSKLDAFRHRHDTTTGHVNGTTVHQAAESMNPDTEDANKAGSQMPHGDSRTQNDCPETPHRIPLADLIANAEEVFNTATSKSATPDDHVFWDHRGSKYRNKFASPMMRGKKRNRSLSPTSSPLDAESKNAAQTQGATKFMKTPQRDIGADLWSRYVGKGHGLSGDDMPKIRLSQLESSSPRTPASAAMRRGRDPSTLRRTNSCNVDWPSSTSKKRRVDGEHFETGMRHEFNRTRSEVVGSKRPKSSKIGLLVDKIQMKMKYPREGAPLPSSPPPAPRRSDSIDDVFISPPKITHTAQPIDTPSKSTNAPANDSNFGYGNESRESSSDPRFADLDKGFIDLAVESADTSSTNCELLNRNRHLADNNENIGEITRDEVGHEPQKNAGSPLSSRQQADIGDQELGELTDDDYGSLDGMEDILSQCDMPGLFADNTAPTSTDSRPLAKGAPVADKQPILDETLDESFDFEVDDTLLDDCIDEVG